MNQTEAISCGACGYPIKNGYYGVIEYKCEHETNEMHLCTICFNQTMKTIKRHGKMVGRLN